MTPPYNLHNLQLGMIAMDAVAEGKKCEREKKTLKYPN